MGALLLVGCTPGDDPDREAAPTPTTPEREAVFTELTLPADMRASTPVLWGASVLAPTDEAPLLVVAARGAGTEPAEVVTWTADGSVPAEQPVDLGLTDTVEHVRAAASDHLAAIVGYTWSGTGHEAFVRTSVDRTTWTARPLPDAVASLALTDVAVVGSTVYAAGTDTEDVAHGVVVDGEEVRTFTLEQPTGADRVAVTGLAGHGAEVLVLLAAATEGDSAGTYAYRSSDGGASWAAPALLDEDLRAGVAGVVRTGSNYVATGTLPDGGVARPAAWVSADGGTWARELVDRDPAMYTDGRAAGLSAPSAAGSSVAAVLWNNDSRYAVLEVRTGTDRWERRSWYLGDLGTGLSGPVVATGDGVVHAVLGYRGSYQLHRIGPDGTWALLGDVGRTDEWTRLDDLESGAEAPVALTTTHTFTAHDDDGWQTASRAGLAEIRETEVVTTTWDPAELADLWSSRVVTADDGSAVAVGTGWVDDASIEVSAFHRPGPGEPWTRASGFDTGARASVDDHVATPGGWVAVGHTGDGPGTSVWEAAAWTSTDGLEWSRAGLEPAGERSEAAAVCALPSGAVLAVGYEVHDGVSRPAAWVERDGTWEPVPDLGETGTLWSCAVVDDEVLVAGRAGGLSTVWSATDAGGALAFDVVLQPGLGDAVDTVVAVPGGYAAFGHLTRSEHVGPVLWLSSDGTEWTWVPVPASSNTGNGSVTVDGADLVVGVNAATAEQVWRVPAIEEVIASLGTP